MIRVALVGAGGIARRYREVYTRIPGVQWALAVDVNCAQTDACLQLGARRASANFDDALAGDIDMLDISTPNHLHAQQAVAALRAGKHVLLQKPMANTLAGADEIVAAAAEAKGVLGLYMSSYANRVNWEVKRLVQSGALGEIQSVRARDAHRGGLTMAPGKWRNSRETTGGGAFIQLSIHSINLMQWILGRRINRVSALGANQYCPNIGGDDVMVAVMQFGPPRGNAGAKPIFGAFESGYASEGVAREIYGTKGYVRLLDDGARVEMKLDSTFESHQICYERPGQVAHFELKRPALDDASSPYNPQRMFVEALQQGHTPHMQAADGRHDLAVVMAAYASAECGRAVDVA